MKKAFYSGLLSLLVGVVFALGYAVFATTTITAEVDAVATILTGANTITLGQPCHNLIIWTSPGASPFNFTLNGTTATAGNVLVIAGSPIRIDKVTAFTKINYYCVTGSPTGTVSYVAW